MQDSKSPGVLSASERIEQIAQTGSVPFWEAFRFWAKLGLITFGGLTGCC